MEFTLSMDGFHDERPLTVGKLKQILNQLPDNAEVAGCIDHAHNTTSIETLDDWFHGDKEGRILLLIM